jgi:NAD(P)-dependent dehydrogenase (short-subunit alcohol dehydrogenase family)/acyl dehydratase
MMTFDQFRVGDYAVFDRTFSQDDFSAFSKLSGDTNPLHCDQAYATEHAADGALIVPLHLTLAPLSRIAGMIFPGEPSLYLGHEVKAIKTIRYGEPLRYSARIVSINQSHRILSLRVLALRGAEVVLDAVMQVQARSEAWASGPSDLIRHAAKGVALVTGASGGIGGAIALTLARNGWRLLLQDRGADRRREKLVEALNQIGADAQFVACDLSQPDDFGPLSTALDQADDLDLVVHTASPGVMASADQLVAVNFSALKRIAGAAVAKMLARQHGSIVLLGSTAVRASPPDWEAYSGAKAMAMNLVDGIERRFASFGVRGYTLAPGYVATRFSDAYRSDSAPVLLPGEVADALIDLVSAREQPGNTVFLEPGSITRGKFGLHSGAIAPEKMGSPVPSPVVAPSQASSPAVVDAIAPLVRAVLRLPGNHDLRGGGLDQTSGWDSLKHIEIILAIETQLGLHFKSSEIEATHRYDDLVALCAQRLTAGAHGS